MPPTNSTTCLRYILILLLGLLPVLPLEGASPADSLLRKLDGMLPGRDRFAAERRQKINSLSAELPRITDLRDRYNIYRGLFSAYRDSSLALFSPSDENYHYLEAWRLMDAARWKEALAEIRRTERRFGPSDSHPAA